jgi:outer membrane protein
MSDVMMPGLRSLRRSLGLAAALLLALMAGCRVDQQKEVATYRGLLDADAPAAVEAPATEEPLTLQHALYLANQNDDQLSIRGEGYLQSLINRARAAAGFLPNVSASASHSVGGEGTRTDNTTSASVGASIQVFNLRTLAGIEQAEASSEQQRLLLLDLQQTVLIGVANSFYSVLTAEENVRVLQNSLALREEQLRDVRARQELGINRPLDLAQAQADVSSTRVSLMQAESNARQARTGLAFLLGLPVVENALLDQFTPPAEIQTAVEFEQAAIDHRLDLAAARQGVEVSSLGVTSAYRQYFPTANLSLSWLLYRTPGGSNPWSATVSLLQPIFNAGLTHLDVRTALSDLRQSALEQERLARVVHEDITLAYEDYVTSTRKLAELEVTVGAAQRAYEQAVAQYRVGNASNLDQLSAQNQLLSAQLQRSQERYNQKLFYLQLLRASGGFGIRTPGELRPRD